MKVLLGIVAAALWIFFVAFLLFYVNGWAGNDFFLDLASIFILMVIAVAAGGASSYLWKELNKSG